MKTAMAIFFAIGLLLTIIIGAFRIPAAISFSNNCGGYLKRAADSNTIETAKIQLDEAISWLDKQGLTEGQIRIFMNQPKNDIKFWYDNIVAARKALDKVSKNATELEKSNVLMKLRETLMDGDSITHPSGISIYPNNAVFGVLSLFAILGVVIPAFYFSEEL